MPLSSSSYYFQPLTKHSSTFSRNHLKMGTFAGLLEQSKYQRQLVKLIEEAHVSSHYGFLLDAMEVLDHCPSLGHDVLANPNEVLALLSEQLWDIQDKLVQERGTGGVAKKNVHVRLVWLPKAHRRASISMIRAKDVNCLLQFSGTGKTECV